MVPFPFSDLSNRKEETGFGFGETEGDDVILCQITSKSIDDEYAIALLDDDFETGSLNQASNIRPNRIFTADRNIILKTVGKIRSAKINETIERIVSVLKNES